MYDIGFEALYCLEIFPTERFSCVESDNLVFRLQLFENAIRDVPQTFVETVRECTDQDNSQRVAFFIARFALNGRKSKRKTTLWR